MSIMDFLAIISFGLSCFSIGYTIGKDNHKTQKQPPTRRLFFTAYPDILFSQAWETPCR